MSVDGSWVGGTKGGRALVMRRAGGHWLNVATTGLGNVVRELDASGGDIWAIGTGAHGRDRLLEFREGRWQPLPFPPGERASSLAALGQGRVWDGVAFWTGERWSSKAKANNVFALAATSPANAWALDVGPGSPDRAHVYSWHWNGRAWTRTIFGPFVFHGLNFPTAIALNGPGGIWAAGWKQLARWNGHGWQTVPLPVPEKTDIAALAATPTDLWIAGELRPSRPASTTILHGTCAT